MSRPRPGDPRLRRLARLHGPLSAQRRQDQQPEHFGYTVAEAMVEVLKRCAGTDTISAATTSCGRRPRSRVLRLPMLLPGILVNTSATDHAPLEQMLMMRFSAGADGRALRAGAAAASIPAP